MAQTASRLLGAVAGGYAFCAALVALLSVALSLADLPRSEAVAAAASLGFVLYLLVLLWAFSVRSLARLWLWLSLGTVAAASLTFLTR